MTKYTFYENSDFDYDNETFDPYDYPMRQTVDYMDYSYTYHFDGSAPVIEKGDN